MSCDCESLDGLRKEIGNIKKLEKTIGNYRKIFERSSESDPVLDDGFVRTVEEFEKTNARYFQSFLDACRSNNIDVHIGRFVLRGNLGYLAAYCDRSTEVNLGFSYHCSRCSNEFK